MLLRILAGALALASLATAQGRVLTVDDGPIDYGSAWHIELDSLATVQSQRELDEASTGFTEVLSDHDEFGAALAALGDLNGDGVVDLAVGAPGDDHGGIDRGAVWILFRAPDGSVASRRRIDAEQGMVGLLFDRELFGSSLAFLGDLDGDGEGELAVGAPGGNCGWILSLTAKG